MTEAKPMIECQGVHKYYGDYHALRGIDLTIRAGEFFSCWARQAAARPRFCAPSRVSRTSAMAPS
ncbi:hypothetical protein FLP41_16695 [Paracoccus marcusii]|uniref:hypothetical protein n=1 Tax=Paracoccus marcusii TaxID=59779 RepID=UPI002ED48F51|nr:hypothetical protein FLP41_16695 [Paracoccus marcusii]